MTENSSNKSTDNGESTESITNAMSQFIQLIAKSVARQLSEELVAGDDDQFEQL